MRISVIVPTLNEAPGLSGILEDIAASLPNDAELIVADGGSTDGTRASAERLAHRIIESPPGRARQMNAGAGAASGEVLWFVHADTQIPADAGAAILDALSRGHAWGRFDVRLSGSRIMFRLVAWFMNQRSRLTGIATGDQALFVLRKEFDAVGGFPDIALMEDIALSKALRKRGRPANLKTRVVTSSRRWEEQGTWRTIVLMWRLRLAFALGADPNRLVRRYYS